MDAGQSRSAADKDDRIRILEYQVDNLRRELELLEKRHAEAIYSVAWHFAWPVRVVERAIRRMFAGRDDDSGGSGTGEASPTGGRAPEPLTRDHIAERIAARIARPA
jgi:hypothetical protein